MIVYAEGYELFEKIIQDLQDLQDLQELNEKKADLQKEEISKIDENILLRESRINEEMNVRRRIILIGILEDKKRKRAVLYSEMKDSKKEITENRSKLYIFKLAQKQLQWGGSEVDYPDPDSE